MIRPQDCVNKYGEPTLDFEKKWMTKYIIPPAIGAALPALPRAIYCNKDMAGPLEQALIHLIDAGITDELRTWDGCFNIRYQRNAPWAMSLHSWGVAVDVNAAWNRLNQIPTLSPDFVKCFRSAGFDWGGVWNRPDGMHFQLKEI